MRRKAVALSVSKSASTGRTGRSEVWETVSVDGRMHRYHIGVSYRYRKSTRQESVPRMTVVIASRQHTPFCTKKAPSDRENVHGGNTIRGPVSAVKFESLLSVSWPRRRSSGGIHGQRAGGEKDLDRDAVRRLRIRPLREAGRRILQVGDDELRFPRFEGESRRQCRPAPSIRTRPAITDRYRARAPSNARPTR